MNKILQIFRHAKSSWENNLPDHERPLKKRGFNDIQIMAHFLKSNYLTPDLIMSSTANRAKTTAVHYIDGLDLKQVPFQLKKELYDFSGENVLQLIRQCDNSVDVLAIFGHNYALTNICNQLGDKHIENVTTSGFVQIEFEQDLWSNIKKGATTKIVFPKHLK